MTLEEMHNKIKEYESKWGKLGHTNIMKPEKYTIEHSGLSKGETKMPNMTNDFYAFRRKVAEGKEKNKIAHTSTINITDLNKKYFEQITTDGTLIHASTNSDYGKKHYTKIDNYYPDGSARYFQTKAEWDAYQEGLKRTQYEQQKKVEQAKQSTGAKSQDVIDAEARSKWEAEKKAEKQANATNKNAKADEVNSVLNAYKQGGAKAMADAYKKTDTYKKALSIYEKAAKAGIDPTKAKPSQLNAVLSKDEIDWMENDFDKDIRRYKNELGDKSGYKDFGNALSEDIIDKTSKILAQNPSSHRAADYEEGKKRLAYDIEQKAKKEKQAKLDADRAKNEAAAKAKSEEEETKSQMSRDKEKNRQADLAEEEIEKNKGVTSQTGKAAPKVKDDSDFKKNSGASGGMSWGKNNKPLTDEEIDELEEAGKPSPGAAKRQELKGKHKENVDKRNAELEDRESEREKEIADKKATTKNAHKENPEDYVKQMPKTTNPKNTKEEITTPSDVGKKLASGLSSGVKNSNNNKSLTIAERDELLKDASNNRASVSELASKYGISEEEVEKLISGVLGGGFKHSAINEEDSVMSEYRAFKQRANEGAKRNRLSHSAVISPADLNAKYYQDIEDHCFLVHASTQYGKGYYQKIEKFYPDGSTRYFYTPQEWEAYQKNKGQNKGQNNKPSVTQTHYLKPADTNEKIEAYKKADQELKEKEANKNAAKQFVSPIKSLAKGLDKQWDAFVDTIEDGKSEEGKRLKDSSKALKKYFKKSTHKLKDADDIANEVLAKHGYKDYDDMLNKEYFNKYPEVVDKKSLTEYTDEEKAAGKEFLNKTVEIANEIKEAQAAEAEKQEKAYELAEDADKQVDIFDDIHKEMNALSNTRKADLADALGVKSLSEKDIINVFMPEINEMEDKFDAGDYNDTYGVEFFQAIIDGMKKFRAAYREARKEIGMD